MTLDWIEAYAWAPSYILALSGVLLINLNDRRAQMLVLGIQYFGMAWLSGLALPFPVAGAKFLAGILTCLILAVSFMSMPDSAGSQQGGSLPSGRIFRLVAAALVVTAAWGLGRRNWMGLPDLHESAIRGGTFLLALGMLQLGLFMDPVGVGLGLLTLLSGFEIIYSALEPSLAVIALLAMVHLGIAIVVGYLLMLRTRDQPQVEPDE